MSRSEIFFYIGNILYIYIYINKMGSNNNSPMANNNSDNWDSPTISRQILLFN